MTESIELKKILSPESLPPKKPKSPIDSDESGEFGQVMSMATLVPLLPLPKTGMPEGPSLESDSSRSAPKPLESSKSEFDGRPEKILAGVEVKSEDLKLKFANEMSPKILNKSLDSLELPDQRKLQTFSEALPQSWQSSVPQSFLQSLAPQPLSPELSKVMPANARAMDRDHALFNKLSLFNSLSEPLRGEVLAPLSDEQHPEEDADSPLKEAEIHSKRDDEGDSTSAIFLPKRISGTDFLSMRNILQATDAEPIALPQSVDVALKNGEKAKSSSKRPGARSLPGEVSLDQVKSGGFSGTESAGVQSSSKRLEMTGQVVRGAMTRERFSTDSVVKLVTGIQKLSAHGGGEMRIRLNPENLGEIRVRITADGGQVGLQVQVQDEKVKRILEESMSSLKEHLSTHSLVLNTVDLNIREFPAGRLDSGTDPRTAMGNENFQGFGDQNFRQNERHDGGSPWTRLERDPSVAEKVYMGQRPGLAAGSRTSESGRIDVRV